MSRFWARWIFPKVKTYTVVSAPAVTYTVLMPRFRLLLAQCEWLVKICWADYKYLTSVSSRIFSKIGYFRKNKFMIYIRHFLKNYFFTWLTQRSFKTIVLLKRSIIIAIWISRNDRASSLKSRTGLRSGMIP